MILTLLFDVMTHDPCEAKRWRPKWCRLKMDLQASIRIRLENILIVYLVDLFLKTIRKCKSAWAFSCQTINASTYLCGKLWWVKGCSHMDPLSSLHQPQLATWTSCDICYTKMCDTGLIHLMTLRCANSCDKVWRPRKRVVRLFESTHFVSPRIFQYVSVKSLQPLHRKL